jgi:hypothetical protein
VGDDETGRWGRTEDRGQGGQGMKQMGKGLEFWDLIGEKSEVRKSIKIATSCASAFHMVFYLVIGHRRLCKQGH